MRPLTVITTATALAAIASALRIAGDGVGSG
jgi:hypothetical protein